MIVYRQPKGNVSTSYSINLSHVKQEITRNTCSYLSPALIMSKISLYFIATLIFKKHVNNSFG